MVFPGAAEAKQSYVACWGAYGGEWGLDYKVKPRECAFNGDEAHAKQTPLVNMRWRSWGGRRACGTGVFVYNQGFRAKTRFCLYRNHPIEGYMRIRGVVGSCFCAYFEPGGYSCGHYRKPTHFRNWTL